MSGVKLVKNWGKNLVSKIETSRVGILSWVASFLAVVMIRLMLESFSANGAIVFGLGSLPHAVFFYASMALFLMILLKLLTGEKMDRIAAVSLVGWILIITPPLIDLLVSAGAGGLRISYIFDNPLNFLDRFLHFFGGTPEREMTYGIRFQAVISCVFIGGYIWIKKRSFWRAGAGMAATYFLTFIYSVIPVLAVVVSRWRMNIEIEEIIRALFEPKLIGQIRFFEAVPLFDFEVGLIFFPLTILGLLIWYFFWDRKKFGVMIRNLRGLRVLFSIIALGAGLYLGARFGHSFDWGFWEILVIFNLFLINICLWVLAININDWADKKIDDVSNQNRPLIVESVPEKEYLGIGCLMGFLGLLAAWNLGEEFLMLGLLMSGLAYLYSMPPFRLRRFVIISTLTLALSIVPATLMAFMIFTPNQSLASFPREILLMMIVFLTIVLNFKDMKDIEGDLRVGVWTIPTIFGAKRGGVILGVCAITSFLLFPIFFSADFLTPISLGFGVVAFLLLQDGKPREKWLFLIYALYLLIFLGLGPRF